ncbi:signal peptidase I [Paenibacillus tarimensis]
MSRSLMRHSRQEEPGAPKVRSKWLTELLDWIKTFAIAVIIVLLLNLLVFNLSTVEGHSMEPTLVEKEWLFVNKAVYLLGKPDRGDVVIVKDPEGRAARKDYLVKRIIGLPGDTVEIRSKQLYLNGELMLEAYTDSDIEDMDLGPFVVEAGTYFLMGDNRHARASRDSRSFGNVPEELIKGRADFILWPITKMGRVK